MAVLWIILAVFLMFILSDYIWLILLLCGAAVVLYFVIKAKRDREEGERQWMIRESQKNQTEDKTHKYYYKTAASPAEPEKANNESPADQAYRASDITHKYYYKTTPASAAVDLGKAEKQRADPLNSFTRSFFSVPHVYQGCSMAYRYPNINVSTVNRLKLAAMVGNKTFRVTPFKDEAGNIFLKSGDDIIAKLEDRVQMCIDWLAKKQPLICEFVSFRAGFEKVALFFYKDEETKLAKDNCEIVRVTSCFAPDKQETISFLEEGEKLFVEYDDDGVPYLRDITYSPIGKLPTKYNSLYDDGLVNGVFFDHSDIKESDDLESNDKHIPYVRIYIEKS